MNPAHSIIEFLDMFPNNNENLLRNYRRLYLENKNIDHYSSK